MPQPKPSTSSSAKSPDTSYRETLASVRLPINALVNALSNTSVAPRPTSNPKLPTSQAYHDLVALSKFCSAHITALGVALKPKADYVAAQAMLDKWLTELRKMELLVGVWVLQCRNEIWDKEVRWAALALAESYHSLYATLASATTTRQSLLSAIGQVWAASSSLADDCSPNVQAAYNKALHDTQETIKDAHAELRDLIDTDRQNDEEEEDDDEDNQDAVLEDFGLNLSGPSAPLEEKEQERVKGLSMVIRLCRLLHKRISDWTLSCPDSDQVLYQLHLAGEDLAAVVDDLVGSVQEPEELPELLSTLKQTTSRMVELPVLPKQQVPNQQEKTLQDQVQSLNLSSTSGAAATTTDAHAEVGPKGSDAEERKWRDMAFAQIDKALAQTESTLS